ncbi:MAG: hypothetical protein ACC657_06290, partial [Thiohalomonadales bacterium]
VTEHAKAMITDLNERSGIPSSSTYASRQISKPKEKTGETKPEDIKTDETKPENTKTDETKSEDIKTDESKPN